MPTSAPSGFSSLDLAPYALASEAAWEACVEGAEVDGDETRVAAARAAASEAADLWEAAELASSPSQAREALVAAARLAQEWGYDAPERDALRALEAVSTNTVR
jgi:hypothetical protein